MLESKAGYYIEKLQHEGWSVRKAAVLALGKLDEPSVVPALIQSLQDEFMSVRAFAAVELGKRGDAAAVPGLIATLQDEEWIVRKNAVMALVKIGEPAAVPALIERLQDGYFSIRAIAAVGLGQRGELAAIPTLVEMLQDEVSGVRAEAAAVLTNMGAPAVGALLQFLSHPPVQRMVGTVLWNMGNATTLPRKILAEKRLSVRDRISVLEKLRRARNPWGRPTFLYNFPETRDLCLAVLKEEDVDGRAGAQTVLDWLNGDRYLVHASQREPANDVQELLRASLSGASELPPETLLRGADDPEKNSEQPSPRRSPWQKVFGKRKHNAND